MSARPSEDTVYGLAPNVNQVVKLYRIVGQFWFVYRFIQKMQA